MISRRGLITGLVSFVAAPAIVRAASLMPVKALVTELTEATMYEAFHKAVSLGYSITYQAINENLYRGFGLAPIKQEGTFEFRVLDPREIYLP